MGDKMGMEAPSADRLCSLFYCCRVSNALKQCRKKIEGVKRCKRKSLESIEAKGTYVLWYRQEDCSEKEGAGRCCLVQP